MKLSKFHVIWMVIAGAALYSPFRRFIDDAGYATVDEFFEDLLSLITGLSYFLVPILLIYLVFIRDTGKDTGKDKDSANKAETQPAVK